MSNKKVIVIDKYTPDEFAKMLFDTRIRGSLKSAEQYVNDNPKEFYTYDDTIEAYYGKEKKRVWRQTPYGTTKRYAQSDTMGSDRF